MSFSLFVLALYVFLQSSSALGWFAVDPKFMAVVGMVFVIAVVVDAIFWARTSWFGRRAA